MFERNSILELPDVVLFNQPNFLPGVLHLSKNCKAVKILRKTVSTTFREQKKYLLLNEAKMCQKCWLFSQRNLYSFHIAFEVDAEFSKECALFKDASPLQQVLDLQTLMHHPLTDYKWCDPFLIEEGTPVCWVKFFSSANRLVKDFNDAMSASYATKLQELSSSLFKKKLLDYLAKIYSSELENKSPAKLLSSYKKEDLLSPAVLFWKMHSSWTLKDSPASLAFLLLTGSLDIGFLEGRKSGVFVYGPLGALLWLSKGIPMFCVDEPGSHAQIALSPVLTPDAEEMVSSLFTSDKDSMFNYLPNLLNAVPLV